jgi:methionyl-tRNA formyltransferase
MDTSGSMRPTVPMASNRLPTGTPRWIFVGQSAMGAAALRALLAHSVPVAVLTAEPALGQWPVAATARANLLRLVHVDTVGPDPGGQWPRVFGKLDVAVCCCWGERLAPAALAAPAHGWLNLHPSTLPAWRGADPVAWQLLAAPSAIGASVHRMTAAHDDGPVVAEGSVPVEASDDRGVVAERSGATLGELAAGVLRSLSEGGELAERPQLEEQATWCPPLGTVPVVEPRSMRASAGARVARAFSPQPGIAAATLAPEQRFALTGSGPELDAGEQPGAVVSVEADHADTAIAFTDRWLFGRTGRGLPGL